MEVRDLEHMDWLTYEPVMPVRRAFLGEVVYAEHWQALVRRPVDHLTEYFPDTPNAMLALILHGLPLGFNQREATVTTTFVVWLGTNCGRSFIEAGRRYAREMNKCLETGYAIAWAMENARRTGTNHGYRLIELLLAPADSPMRARRPFLGDLFHASASTLPELTAIDYETCEHFAAWLGTELGQAFVIEAEREIELRQFARPAAAPAAEEAHA